MKNPSPDFIVKSLGGITATARLFEIKPPSVAEWVSKNHIPKARVQFLRLARPDLFPTANDAAAQEIKPPSIKQGVNV